MPPLTFGGLRLHNLRLTIITALTRMGSGTVDPLVVGGFRMLLPKSEEPRIASVRVLWRDVREAEGARLESVCGGNLTVGSNPTLSAGSPKLEDSGLGLTPNNSQIVRRMTI